MFGGAGDDRRPDPLFLRAIANGAVYYDTALKIDPATGLKRRSQFRIRHDKLVRMYHQSEFVELDVGLGHTSM